MNELSLEEAYRRWADELVGYASVLVPAAAAADVVAEAFADLLSQDHVRWSRVGDAKGFLFGVIANRARMYHRGTGRRRRRERQPSLSVAGVSSGSVLADPEVVDALDSLSMQQRQVVYLTYWADYPVDRVAEILGVGDGTVRRQLARARARLREVLS